jgi:hypothetical protein
MAWPSASACRDDRGTVVQPRAGLSAAGTRITGVAPIAREHVPSEVSSRRFRKSIVCAPMPSGGWRRVGHGLAKAIALERGVPVAAVPRLIPARR